MTSPRGRETGSGEPQRSCWEPCGGRPSGRGSPLTFSAFRAGGVPSAHCSSSGETGRVNLNENTSSPNTETWGSSPTIALGFGRGTPARQIPGRNNTNPRCACAEEILESVTAAGMVEGRMWESRRLYTRRKMTRSPRRSQRRGYASQARSVPTRSVAFQGWERGRGTAGQPGGGSPPSPNPLLQHLPALPSPPEPSPSAGSPRGGSGQPGGDEQGAGGG